MKRFYTIFLSSLILFCSNLFAYDEADLQTLLQSKSCTSGTFSSCDLEGAQINGQDLSDANLEGAILKNAVIYNTSLSRANLENADLTGAILKFVDLSGANLTDSKLINTSMLFVDFSEATLSNAFIQGSKLKGVYFNNAVCEEVEFGMVETKLVDFSGATGIKAGSACAEDSFGSCR